MDDDILTRVADNLRAIADHLFPLVTSAPPPVHPRGHLSVVK